MLNTFIIILFSLFNTENLGGVSKVTSAKIRKPKTLELNILSLDLLYRQLDVTGINAAGDTITLQDKQAAGALSLGFLYSVSKHFAFSFTIKFQGDGEDRNDSIVSVISPVNYPDPNDHQANRISLGFGDFIISGKFSQPLGNSLYLGASPFLGVPLGEDTFGIVKDASSSPRQYTGGYFRRLSSKNVYGGLKLLFSVIPDERVGIHFNIGYTTSRFGGESDYVSYGTATEIIPGSVQPYIAFYGRYYLHDKKEGGIYRFGRGFNFIEGGLGFTSSSGVKFTLGINTTIGTFSTRRVATDFPEWTPNFGVYLSLGYTQPEKKEEIQIPVMKTGEIAGRIFDKRTGAPVFAKVSVKIDTTYVETVSDSITGEYRIKDIPEGIYVIKITAPGYREQGATVAVREKETTVRDFALFKVITKKIPKGTLTGKVQEKSTGRPLYAKISFVGSNIKPVYTDSATGIFKIDLPEGTYALKVEAEGYIPQARPVVIERGESKIENFSLLKKGMRLIFRNIYFDLGKATIKPQSFAVLDSIAKMLKENPNIIVEIQGHTDNVGSEEYNLELSQRRAEAVKNYLVQVHGIDPLRLIARGYGEYRPIASNNTPEGRAQNRRVEFVILGTTEEQ